MRMLGASGLFRAAILEPWDERGWIVDEINNPVGGTLHTIFVPLDYLL